MMCYGTGRWCKRRCQRFYSGSSVPLVRCFCYSSSGSVTGTSMDLLRPLAANEETVALQDEILRSLRQILRQKHVRQMRLPVT